MLKIKFTIMRFIDIIFIDAVVMNHRISEKRIYIRYDEES